MKHALGVGGDGDVGVSRGGEREPVGDEERGVSRRRPAPAAGSRAHSRAACAAHTTRRAMSSLTSLSARSHRPE